MNQLVIIAGLEGVDDPVEHELPIGKNEADKSVAVLEDLADVNCVMRVQMEYGCWNGNIQERKVIKAFFRADDHASAEEIVKAEAGEEVEFGQQWEREQKYLNNVTYNDGLNEELVKEWIAAKRPQGTAPDGGSAPAGDSEPPKFGKKRSFGK